MHKEWKLAANSPIFLINLDTIMKVIVLKSKTAVPNITLRSYQGFSVPFDFRRLTHTHTHTHTHARDINFTACFKHTYTRFTTHTRLERYNKLSYATISPHKYQKHTLIQIALTESVAASQRTRPMHSTRNSWLM